jgi:hypothetical protein
MPKQAELAILSTRQNKEPYFNLSKAVFLPQKLKAKAGGDY